MDEFVTESVVLEKRVSGEADAIITLYTKDLGRVTAFARSSRKITSKLSAHLEPSILSTIRLVRRRMFHIVDAVQIQQFPDSEQIVRFMLDNTLDAERDLNVWNTLLRALNGRDAKSGMSSLLQSLGYNPAFAACVRCDVSPVRYVLSEKIDFYCALCGENYFRNPFGELIAVS